MTAHLQALAGHPLAPWVARQLQDERWRIIITGASGWLGMAALGLLADALGDDFVHRVAAFGSSARRLELRHGRSIEQALLAAMSDLPAAPSLVLHFAFLTKDRVADLDEAAYRAANAAIAETVEAALVAVDARAVFVASSGAAGVAGDPHASPAMRLYGGLKLDDEARFAAWAISHARRAVIGRVFNITGPYINKPQHYALAAFILDALAGRTVAVKAPCRVERGMVAVADLLSVAFAELVEPAPGICRFETGGEPMELGALAAEVAVLLGAPGHHRAAITAARIDRYVGNDTAWSALLARHGIAPQPLAAQIRETADFLAEAGVRA